MRLLHLILLILSFQALHAQSSSYVLANVRVIDVKKGKLWRGLQDVHIEQDRIIKIDKHRPDLLEQEQVVDGQGHFLLPGLWDMHTHPDDPEVWRMQPTNAEKDKLLGLFIAYGVTGIRDMAGDLELANSWKNRIKTGELQGPIIYAAGPLLDGPNPMWDGSVGINNEEHVPIIVDSLIEAGIDFLKVYSLLPRDIYFALNRYANSIDFPIVGHVPMSVKPSEAAEAGIWCQEHLLEMLPECSSREEDYYAKRIDYGAASSRLEQYIIRNQFLLDTYDPKKAKNLFKLFAKHRTWHTPTLSMWYKNAYYEAEWAKDETYTQYLPKYLQKYWTPAVNDHLRNRASSLVQLKKNQVDKYLEMTLAMHKAGVPLLAGTDVGANPLCHPGIGLYNELEMMIKAGLSPAEALKTATINPAVFLRIDQEHGSLEAGKVANMVLFVKNPLQDIKNLHTIRLVINKGALLTEEDRANLLQEIKSYFDQIDYE